METKSYCQCESAEGYCEALQPLTNSTKTEQGTDGFNAVYKAEQTRVLEKKVLIMGQVFISAQMEKP